MKTIPLNNKSLPDVWDQVLVSVGPLFASQLEKAGLPTIVPRFLKLRFAARYQAEQAFCQEPSRVARFEKAVADITGIRWGIIIESVQQEPSPTDAPLSATSDEGINNCFFKLESTILHDDLRFRSPAEIAVYEELKTRELLFFPNAAAVIGGKKPVKKEPDFLIFQEGKCGILEVMGKGYHTNDNAVKDHERARLFKSYGVLCIEFLRRDRMREEPRCRG